MDRRSVWTRATARWSSPRHKPWTSPFEAAVDRIAENVWILRYPLRLLGVEIGRSVTIIRLGNGKLVIHSTAPFTAADVAAIQSLGKPGWMVDVTAFHNSFAEEGRRAFPLLRYLVPDRFPKAIALKCEPLDPAPAEWAGQLEVLRIEGVPRIQEHAVFHAPSRTLIVGDLLFNFGQHALGWTKFFARRVMRLKELVGMSPFFRMMIRDQRAFDDSIRKILRWEFDRIIVGHGEIIEFEAKQRVSELLSG